MLFVGKAMEGSTNVPRANFLKKLVPAAKFAFEKVLLKSIVFAEKIRAQKESLNKLTSSSSEAGAILAEDVDREAIHLCVKAWEACSKASKEVNEANELASASCFQPHAELMKLDFSSLWDKEVQLLGDIIQLESTQLEEEIRGLVSTLSEQTFDKHMEDSSWKKDLLEDASLDQVQMAVSVHLADLKGMKIHATVEKISAVACRVTSASVVKGVVTSM